MRLTHIARLIKKPTGYKGTNMREDLAGIIIETDVETDGKDPRRLAFLAEEQARKDARTAVMLGPLAADAEKNAVAYERDMNQIYGASDNYNSFKHQELSDLLGNVTPLSGAQEARMTDQQDWDDRPKWWRERN